MSTTQTEQVVRGFQDFADICRMLGKGYDAMGAFPLATSFCDAAELFEDLSERVAQSGDPAN